MPRFPEDHPLYGDLGHEDGRSAQRRARERARPEPAPRRAGPFAGRGPKGYHRSDERVREEVCDRLMADPEIDPGELSVSVADGEVTLEGSVPEPAMKRAAEACAEGILGVRHVHDRLRVAPRGGDERSGEARAASGARREESVAESRRSSADPETPL